jgi:surface carbohydrate biosynthesis protein (TIGR04326 family)
VPDSASDLTMLLIWDAEGAPPTGDWTMLLWRGFGNSALPNAISVHELVEANADNLKSRYLEWVYELGETTSGGRSLIDRLNLWPGFSYWWMSLLLEKCNYSKSPQIDHAVRLMAFEQWMTGRPVAHVALATCNALLAECVRSWCSKKGCTFEWRREGSDLASQPSRLRRLYHSLPYPVQALSWLVLYVARRWALKGVGLREWRESNGQTTFVSYLFNLVPAAVEAGRFESRFWAHLPEVLRQRADGDSNWLHLYVKDALLPNSGKAADVIREFNKAANGRQTHVTLDTFLAPGVILNALRDWLRLRRVGAGLRGAFFSPSGSEFDFWPLFNEDWKRSFFGREALNNLLFYRLFEVALRYLPKQRVGVYLQENQGWEFALIHNWRAAGHGRLIGAEHSTVRYWDLRYFFDPRSYRRGGMNELPMPDQVVVNGAAARDAYLKGGYPEDRLVEVEALRYLHLAGAMPDANFVASPRKDTLRVLALGDFLPVNTRHQMRLLERAARYLPVETVFTVKPHPACPIRPEDYPGVKLMVTMEPITKLLTQCDVAYTSSTTSAAVDAYCANVPVVSVLDPYTLNLSPLRGREGVQFACTPAELAGALRNAPATHFLRTQEFFTLDPELPRWRELLLGTAA